MVGFLSSGMRRRILTRKVMESDFPDPVVCQMTPSRLSHDVAASYGWCVPIRKKKSHEITLRLASDGTGEVFMEQIHVFVDGSNLKDPTLACRDGDILPDP